MRTRHFNRTALFVLAMFATSSLSAPAQWHGAHSNGFGATIHGNPPSVTSFNFGGHPGFHGVPPSVTSLNFGNSPVRTNYRIYRPFYGPRRYRNPGFYSPFYGNVVAVPYAYPLYVTDPGVDDSMEEEDYRGGPTVFDRRGPGPSEYAVLEPRTYQEQNRDEDYRAGAPAEPAPQPEVADQPRTVLVFKDGRRLEISNYAIAGSTLYDLSDGRARKVALAELDLPATLKQNDDRGVDFQLPVGTNLN